MTKKKKRHVSVMTFTLPAKRFGRVGKQASSEVAGEGSKSGLATEQSPSPATLTRADPPQTSFVEGE